ncbi:hypothetical protein F2Q70_00037452 [Brassica cretica]|uniref:Uncharacterized protein n=1 Tax=Brassica cretica TaxID=69181 RepID=A0A8S9JRS0_BRACR|nr:hypothetical protein F2Q70_00037452 [Brassica cretica]
MGSWILKSLLLKLLVVLIQNHADGGSIVRYLPGFEGPLPFQLETGYIGVGEGEEDQLFYYFIKSERNPEEDPLLVWLAGGPGCSSFSGLVYENGPLAFKVETYNGSVPSLVSTTYSWTKVANIIYLDQPVGTGFSYSRNQLADTPSDTEAAKRVNEFLRKWLVKHPEYFSNPLYVAGNSYSGIVIPAIVQEISNGNDICCEPQINLKGYLLGNPLTDGVLDGNARIPFAHRKALISDELYDSMKRSCGGNYFNVFPLNTECLKLVEEFKQVCVGEGEEDQLFYYFIKSERNPEEDPLLVWLAGGPGCSSFSGLVYENGPLGFKVETYNGSIPSLVSTTYSWTKVANIIYLDQPVGTGFSYSRNQLSDTPSDTEAAKRVNEFLRKWLVKHPEYFSNPLYVAGNSYSGIVIPAIVQEISNGNDICCEPQINLKGYLLGNPLTDSVLDGNARIPFAHGKALISDELYDSMKRSCGGNYFNVFPLNTECLKLVEEFKQCVFRIYEELILASNCDPKSPDCYTYRYSLSEYWANNESVRRALKVVKWLAKHPEYYSNPFYVTGNSYSGIVVPAIVQEISNENGLCCKPLVNLQGYLLGNPVTDFDNNDNWRIPFAHGMALISDENYQLLRRSCRGNYIIVDPLNTDCLKSVQEFENCVSGLDVTYILGLKYVNASDPYVSNPSEHRMSVLSNCWANDESVRRALHVEKGSIGEWLRCYREIPYKFDIRSSVPYHKNNSIQGYRSLIFSGDHDMYVPFLATQDWIRSLNYSIIDDWRPWMIHNQVAGYTRTYANNMTFATVKASLTCGHTMVYKPEECSVMFERWINGQPL